MFLTLSQVALGGALGASARYLTGVAIMRGIGTFTFPLGVIAVNILGSFMMGVLVVVLGTKGLTHWNALFATGFLGGFTTFSSFSLEAWRLFDTGAVAMAALYVALSVCLSLLALVAGVYLMRGVFA